MLRHTGLRRCWGRAQPERMRLRTKALMELREWDACVRQGRGLESPEVAAWVRLCERRKERGS